MSDYTQELTAIYHEQARIWREAIGYLVPGANENQQELAGAAFEICGVIQTVVTGIITSRKVPEKAMAVYLLREYMVKARACLLAAAMYSVTVDSIAAVCNEIVPLTPAGEKA